MIEPKKAEKAIKYICVELSSPSVYPTSLWAAEVDNEARTFNGQFDRDDENECMDAVEALLCWAYEGTDKENTDVEFVVWKKDLLVSMLTRHKADCFTHDWLDFISYYAGTRGLSYFQATNELAPAEWGTEGVSRAQRLARMFDFMLRMAKSYAHIISIATTIGNKLTDIKGHFALMDDIFDKGNEKDKGAD